MPRIVAFDLGTANIKATVWNVSGRKSSFVDRWIMPVPQSGDREGLLQRQLVALQAMIDEHPEATSGGVVIGAVYGGPSLNLAKVELPFTDKKQIETTLPFAVEESVPFDLESRVMAWRTLRSELTTQTLVALSDEDHFGELLDGMADAKVEPRRVFADQELLGRWAPAELILDPEADQDEDDPLDIAQSDATPVTAVIDLGHTQSLVVVYRGQEMLAGRTLDLGGADITERIASGLNCSWANAERLKCGLLPEPDTITPPPRSDGDGSDEEPEAADEEPTDPDLRRPVLTPYNELPPPGLENLPEQLQRDIDEVLSRLLAELRATLLGLEDRLGAEVKQVVLGGGNARFPDLANRLQDDLSVSVLWAGTNEGSPVPCEYLLADAAAEVLAGKVSMSTIDLRTGPFKWRSGFDGMQAVTTYGFALVLFYTVALGGLFAWQTFTLSGQLSEVERRIDDTFRQALGPDRSANPIQASRDLERQITQAKARAAALTQSDKPPTIHMIYRLSRDLPPPKEAEIDIDVLTLTPNVLKFDAEVNSYAAAEQIEVKLREVERFSKCTKSNEQQRRGKVLFSMTCPLTDEAPEEG